MAVCHILVCETFPSRKRCFKRRRSLSLFCFIQFREIMMFHLIDQNYFSQCVIYASKHLHMCLYHTDTRSLPAAALAWYIVVVECLLYMTGGWSCSGWRRRWRLLPKFYLLKEKLRIQQSRRHERAYSLKVNPRFWLGRNFYTHLCNISIKHLWALNIFLELSHILTH